MISCEFANTNTTLYPCSFTYFSIGVYATSKAFMGK